MATLVKTPSGTWKALIRKNGWPTVAKTFRTKRDAEDWSRRTEEEMVQSHVRRLGDRCRYPGEDGHPRLARSGNDIF